MPAVDVIGIAAVARNGVIGTGEDIPWRIPADWARFQRLTLGHVLVMGRRTYDSIGRPLRGRTTIVVTRDPAWRVEGVQTVRSVFDALPLATALGADRTFVAGGGEIYRALWPNLTALEVTEVDLAPDGTVRFPVISPEQWREVSREPHDGFCYVRYERLSQR